MKDLSRIFFVMLAIIQLLTVVSYADYDDEYNDEMLSILRIAKLDSTDIVGSKNNHVIFERNDGTLGIENINGKKLLDDYSSVCGHYSEGLILAYNGSLTDINSDYLYYVDTNGNIILNCPYDMGYEFMGGKAVVEKDNKYGLIDKNGTVIVPLIYDSILNTYTENVVCEINDASYILNTKTNTKIGEKDFHFPSEYDYIREHECLIVWDETGKAGVIDMNGNIIVPFIYDRIHGYSDGYFTCVIKDGWPQSTYALVDLNGQEVLVEECNMMGFYSNGYVSIVDGQELYYTSLDNQIITVNDDRNDIMEVSPFYDERAVIQFMMNDTSILYYAIDKSGNRVSPYLYTYMSNFANGLALVCHGSSLENGRWQIIDTDFRIVLELDDDIYFKPDPLNPETDDFSDEIVKTINRDTGKMGYLYLDLSETPNRTVHSMVYNIQSEKLNDNYAIVYSTGSNCNLDECKITKQGYTFSHWTDGTNIYYPGDTFIMPDHDVTMTAVWNQNQIVVPPVTPVPEPTPTPTPSVPEYQCPYTDITDHWAKDYIIFTHKNKLIDGITATEFKPKEPMTREMFVIALARMMGIEKDYIDWAVEIGLILGYGDGNLGLEDTVTREQMAVFFERYLNLSNTDINSLKQQDKVEFSDDATISDWAKSSVYKMQEIKLLQGKENMIFDPLDEASRAEGATVIYNLNQILK